MSHLRKAPFQLTFVAAAVLSLSACSTSPKIAGIDLGQVGSGIGKVGSRTAEIGASAWEGTKSFLNMGDHSDDVLDDVDLALMEDDVQPIQLSSEPLLPQDGQGLEAQGIAVASVPTLDISTEGSSPKRPELDVTQPALSFGQKPETTEGGDIVVLASFQGEDSKAAIASDDDLLASAQPAQVPRNDLTYDVAEDDTLWVIAKTTTGDANNWHVIADINDLAPDASVYPGQKLIIPADMVKPGYGGVLITPETNIVEAPALTNELMPEPANVALNVPQKTTEPVEVVAAAEVSAPASAPAVTPANLMDTATALKVGEGETLWDFAKRTTGDATNWQSIAEKNLLTEQQIGALRPGHKIYVPNDMVRSRDENGTLIAKGDEGTVPTATVGGVTPTNKAAIDASAAVLAGTNTPAEGTPIKIVEAAFQGDSGIKPVTAESLAAEASEEVAANDEAKVMVRGTYYPKAVYNEADFSSSLLMRVSPGTQLMVSKAIGPWLEVQTDKGVGYVHSRDIK